MKVIPATWGDLGYRKLSDLKGMSARECASRISTLGGYKILEHEWIRHPSRVRSAGFAGPVKMFGVIRKGDALSEELIKGLIWHEEKSFGQKIRLNIKLETSVNNVMGVDIHEKPWKWHYLVGLSSTFSTKNQLEHLLANYYLPQFFGEYPDGLILPFSYNFEYEKLLPVQRLLYTVDQAGLEAIKNLPGEGRRFPTLSEWDHLFFPDLGNVMLDIMLHAFYPWILGNQAGDFGFGFLYLFDRPVRYRKNIFPDSWFDLPLAQSTFAKPTEERTRFVFPIPGSEEEERAAHQRYLHSISFSANERHEFAEWYLHAMGQFLFQVFDSANFGSIIDPVMIDPRSPFEHMYTITRLARRTLGCCIEQKSIGVVSLCFEIADIYDSLFEFWVRRKKRRKKRKRVKDARSGTFFKILFHPKHGRSRTLRGLSKIPGVVGEYLRKMCDVAYDDLRETVEKGIWLPGAVNAGWVKVNSGKNKSRYLPLNLYVATQMRSLRNMHHGVLATENRPYQAGIIFPSKGYVPKMISTLPTLWLLAFLADPSFVEWSPLDMEYAA